jgi:AcrR family transcriptional regulator
MTAATRRPGGRTERNRAAVLRATLSVLAEQGFAALTVEAVAERSDVHRTTIYRRWGSADGLIAAALAESSTDAWQPPDTGSLESDLRELTRELVRGLTSPGDAELPSAVISAAFQSERAAQALREFYAERHRRCAVIAERAVERGELPQGTDEVEIVRAACAPIFYRLFISREPVDAGVADAAAATAAVAARAGAFRRRD